MSRQRQHLRNKAARRRVRKVKNYAERFWQEHRFPSRRSQMKQIMYRVILDTIREEREHELTKEMATRMSGAGA